MIDDLTQTYIFDSDPTFTKIRGLGMKTLVDETKANMVPMQVNNTKSCQLMFLELTIIIKQAQLFTDWFERRAVDCDSHFDQV